MANANSLVTNGELQYFGQEFKKKQDVAINAKATKATTLEGYGIADAYTKEAVDTELGKKADSATTLAGYGITDSMTAEEINTEIDKKATKASTLAGYGITDAMTSEEVGTAIFTAVNNSKHLKKAIVTAEEVTAFEADPSTADANTIYLLKDEDAEGEDVYKEYTVVGEGESLAFVCTGSTTTDLSDYVKSEDIVYATNDDIDASIAAIFGSSEE